jgi:hypothetical protein
MADRRLLPEDGWGLSKQLHSHATPAVSLRLSPSLQTVLPSTAQLADILTTKRVEQLSAGAVAKGQAGELRLLLKMVHDTQHWPTITTLRLKPPRFLLTVVPLPPSLRHLTLALDEHDKAALELVEQLPPTLETLEFLVCGGVDWTNDEQDSMDGSDYEYPSDNYITYPLRWQLPAGLRTLRLSGVAVEAGALQLPGGVNTFTLQNCRIDSGLRLTHGDSNGGVAGGGDGMAGSGGDGGSAARPAGLRIELEEPVIADAGNTLFPLPATVTHLEIAG